MDLRSLQPSLFKCHIRARLAAFRAILAPREGVKSMRARKSSAQAGERSMVPAPHEAWKPLSPGTRNGPTRRVLWQDVASLDNVSSAVHRVRTDMCWETPWLGRGSPPLAVHTREDAHSLCSAGRYAFLLCGYSQSRGAEGRPRSHGDWRPLSPPTPGSVVVVSGAGGE